MTHAKKALELFKHFYDALPSGELESVKYEFAMKCALKMVDEMISEYELNIIKRGISYKPILSNLEYWRKVRKEIILL